MPVLSNNIKTNTFMKKLVLFQSRVGYSYSVIKTELSNQNISDIQTDNDNHLLLYKIDKDVSVFYYFKSEICTTTVMRITVKYKADEIIKLYNSKYNPINSTTWSAESKLGTVYATFHHNIKGKYYTFTWK